MEGLLYVAERKLSAIVKFLVENMLNICISYCIVTGSCRPFQRSARYIYELAVCSEFFVTVNF